MSAITRELDKIWNQLRSQNPSRSSAVTAVSLSQLRGIGDLRVPLPFPVTVLAGPNGCGKSTVLFALACAYKVPGAKLRTFVPSTLFPNFHPKGDEHRETCDQLHETLMDFTYVDENQQLQMRWSRGKSGWHRSFFGRKSGTQPQRNVYLRTLANLSNPAEVRSVLQMAQKKFSTAVVDASNIAFAQRILTFRYSALRMITTAGGNRDLLFAERADSNFSHSLLDTAATCYSEFHMSAGERAILRLPMHISKMQGALVLIDEIEAGLHPQIQQLLMLELQRLALRNQLQIVVTTHSPAILETVPPEARVFLERTADGVVRREPYRDVVQKALYGQSLNTLSILCEDEEGEAFVRGVLDHLGPTIDLLQNDILVGRDTGKNDFPGHVETLGRFRKLRDFIFVLDGDGRDIGPKLDARAERLGQTLHWFALPGDGPPETWAWQCLQRWPANYAPFLGLQEAKLREQLSQQEQLFESATDKPSEISKNRLRSLAEFSSRTVPDVIREIAKHESEQQRGEAKDIVDRLHDIIQTWRSEG